MSTIGGENVDVLPPISPRVSISPARTVFTFFGIGRSATRGRKALVSLVWNLSWGFGQFVSVIEMSSLVRLRFRSPYNPTVSEWDACDRPLGVLSVLWLIRVVLASSLAYWGYRRDRQLWYHDHAGHLSDRSDIESANDSTHSAHQTMSQGQQPNDSAADPPSPLSTQLYSSFTQFSTLVTLLWFVTGNIFVYTSINTCRYAAPRLWWFNFALLLRLYLIILEAAVLSFVVLIVMPILFLFRTIFLVCIGRHPLQNPGIFKPEIGKLPKSIVDRIPLVIYIPPPDELSEEMTFPYIYPPQPKKIQTKFKVLQNLHRTSSQARSADKEPGNDNETNANSWADDWGQGQFPFVTLAGNRAACAICLADFEAPPKRTISSRDPDRGRASPPVVTSTVETSTAEVSTPDPAGGVFDTVGGRGVEPMKFEGVGAGAQPLRLLGCTHAFHQTCIDPWLTDVSGRCPICQMPVEPIKPHKSRRL